MEHVDVLIRADASIDIGTGHVLRNVVIAGWLQRAGLSVAFASRRLDGDLIDRVRAGGIDVFELDDAGAPRHDTWLSVDLDVEIAAMIKLISRLSRPPRWVIVDHYELDARWEREIAQLGIRICAIDDLANRPHDVDILLDANVEDVVRYAGLVPDRTRLFIGMRFTPVRDAFVRERESARVRDGTVRRILIFYGGVDWTDETTKALRAFRLVPHDLQIDVVVGFSNPRRNQIEAAIDAEPRARLCAGDGEMAELTASADLALGAIGGAMWERFFVGCPSIVTGTLDICAHVGPVLAPSGAMVWLGNAAGVREADVAAAVLTLLEDPQRVRDMSRSALALSNGYLDARAAFVASFLT
jgi:UDP-2,4-diacetamido-2,4,6-trideoxy-beta-L-altropyranose hydrolase